MATLNEPGFNVEVPDQANGKAVTITTQALGSRASMPDGQGFKLGRLIANIMINRADAGSGDRLDPPATLTITFTDEDVRRADGKEFKVAYWSEGGGWVILKENIPCTAADVQVEFSKLGDPPVGAGP